MACLGIYKGSQLNSKSSAYIIEEILGSGTFGLAVKSHKTATNEKVVLKMTKKTITTSTEEDILTQLKAINPDKYNLVRWEYSFVYDGHLCQEFELLDITLKEFLHLRGTLSLIEIRPIIHQLATALEALKNLGIVHADLKPQNIMMVDHELQPLKVKVIDFGSSMSVHNVQEGWRPQTRWYRAPEVLLGLPCTEAIDMWSLGCIAVELFHGLELYPGDCEYDMIWSIAQSHKQFPQHLLNAGSKTSQFFKHESDQWRVMTPEEYGVPNVKYFTILDDLKKTNQESVDNLLTVDSLVYTTDLEDFVELVMEMLQLDPSKRITPRQVLQHQFITMQSILDFLDASSFAQSSVDAMDSCHCHLGIPNSSRVFTQQPRQQTPSDCQAFKTHDLPSGDKVSDSSSFADSSTLTRNSISAKVREKRHRSSESVVPKKKRKKICKEESPLQMSKSSTFSCKRSYDTEEEDTCFPQDSFLGRKRRKYDRDSASNDVPNSCIPSANKTKTCLKWSNPEKTRKTIWITGSSYIARGEADALDIFGFNLGLMDATVKWCGKEEMFWNDVLPCFYAELSAQRCPPDILVIHAGGNDLGLLSASELLSSMTRDLTHLHKEFPSMKVIYSHIIERKRWKNGKPLKVFKDRNSVNNGITKNAKCFGGETVEHPNLTFVNNQLYEQDGVHLTLTGNDIFFTNIRCVIKKILRGNG